MTITILTLFPGLFRGYLESSILARAISRDLVGVKVLDIRDFAVDKHHVCDDAAYGGGPGMVMKPEPIAAALDATTAPGARVLYLTPAGRLFTQRTAQELAEGPDFTLLCGRYEGIDQRVIDFFVTDEISIGDYVLSGGETAAMVVVDSIARLLPGVITGESLREESFSEGLLEYPHYTRPEVFRGVRVPEVLVSGHHEKIRQWRLLKSVEKTMRYRPELLDSVDLSTEARDLAGQIRKEGDGHGRDEIT
ncbi:MAG: tRNA (guanosine(37)-N1)-methyltransferase TrmD [Spirochaetia bacterium]|jgi:tRNA (guanine37-N1)-methyltransferase